MLSVQQYHLEATKTYYMIFLFTCKNTKIDKERKKKIHFVRAEITKRLCSDKGEIDASLADGRCPNRLVIDLGRPTLIMLNGEGLMWQRSLQIRARDGTSGSVEVGWAVLGEDLIEMQIVPDVLAQEKS